MRLQASSLFELANALHVSETQFVDLEHKYCPVSVVSVEEFLRLALTIGKAEGKFSEAEGIVSDLEERIDIVRHKLKFIDENAKPNILCLASIHPPLIEDNPYLADIIKIAGGKTYDVKQVEKENLNPDILMVVANPMESLFEDLPHLLSLDKWKSTNAVKSNAVFLLDGKSHFQGFGLQLADDIESLAEMLYPQQLTYGRNGDTWIQFEV